MSQAVVGELGTGLCPLTRFPYAAVDEGDVEDGTQDIGGAPIRVR